LILKNKCLLLGRHVQQESLLFFPLLVFQKARGVPLKSLNGNCGKDVGVAYVFSSKKSEGMITIL
jgi:hypothetical protein